MSEEGLAGRTVVVTGAASGIGRAIALGAHADGATVVAGDVDEAGLAALATDRLLTLVADVTVDAEVQGLVDAGIARTGRVDVLVNNAGIAGRGRVETMPEGVFERTMAVHTFSALYGMRAALPHMRAAGYGRIVNTLSRGAEIPSPGASAYSAAKAALLALTRTAAAEVRDTDILVNGMIPGPTNTAIWGVDRADLQPPESVWPGVRWLMTLPAGGPSGRVFWDRVEYRLFHPDHDGGRGGGR